MKKKIIIIILCSLLLILSAVVVFFLWDAGVFVLDRSAVVTAESVTWNGQTYSYIRGEYKEGRTIAKDRDGNWKINAVEEDPSHKFIVVRSVLDNYLLVSDDYDIPTSGELTKVYWKHKYISDAEFLEAVAKIEAEKMTSFTYKTEGASMGSNMKELSFAYENCPVATNYKGYMGKVNGEWVITTEIKNSGYPNPQTVSCYRIPEEYWDILSEYFGS